MTDLRRSTRLASKQNTPKSTLAQSRDTGSLTYFNEPAEDADDDIPPPISRRRFKVDVDTKTRTAKRAVKGKRGKLADLPNMPLDILFEIFGHLFPLDLLHLSWSTKSLRNVLMRRSAISVWKQARSYSDGLPDCPPDLTEPQYARLAFDNHCYYCGAAGVTSVMWACRVRCCNKCAKSQFLDPDDHVFSALVPSELRATILPPNGKPILPFQLQRVGRWSMARFFLRQDVLLLVEQYESIRHDDVHVKNLVNTRLALTTAKLAHAEVCAAWYRCVINKRTNELEDARMKRKEAIISKLEELGWTEELQKINMWAFSNHPLVKQPKILTDRIWQNMRAAMIEYMQETRSRRLKQERLKRRIQRQAIVCRLVEAFSKSCSPEDIIPSVADICEMEPFRMVINLPQDVAVDADSYSEAMPCLPELIRDWRETKSQFLADLIPWNASVCSCPVSGLDRLDLATTFFKCLRTWTGCGEIVGYPRILVHSCMTRLYWSFGDRDEVNEQTEQAKCFIEMGCETWNCGGNRVAFDERASKCASDLITLCGKDPQTTTALQMTELDARFSCQSCKISSKTTVMDWIKAVAHTCIHHTLDDPPEWTRLSDEMVIKAKAAERSPLDLSTFYRYNCLHCVRCRRKLMPECFYNHMKAEHNLDTVSESDYYFPVDTPVQARPPFPVSIELAT